VLPATLETTQWGWLDPKEPPKLVVNSATSWRFETMMHAHNKVQPGTTMEEIVALRRRTWRRAALAHRADRRSTAPSPAT